MRDTDYLNRLDGIAVIDESSISHITLGWTLSPPNFLEGCAPPTCDGYLLTFKNGEIEARITPDRMRVDDGMAIRIHEDINAILSALGMARQKVATLSEYSRTEVLHDGSRVIYAEICETLVLTDGVEDRIVSADGNIVFDSKRARREEEQRLLSQVSLHAGNLLLRRLLRSYRAAQRDSADELVHLYEIAEGLAFQFGSRRDARRKLMVAEVDWSLLGRFANDEPVRQGRHRGKMGEALRDATLEELEDCRRVARILVNSYLNLLDRELLATTPMNTLSP